MRSSTHDQNQLSSSMKHWIVLALIVSSLSACNEASSITLLEPNTLVVATTGSDDNPGTLEKPFKTVQNCADVALPGFTCAIRAGTYRESVRPPRSGSSDKRIVFKSFPGEIALISGTEVVSDWTGFQGSIQKASLPANFDLGVGKNQVFVDGRMMLEARFPNAGLDLLHQKLGNFKQPITGSGVTWTINAPTLPSVNLTGANINFLPGPTWVIETGKIDSSSATSFTFSSPGGQMVERPVFAPSLFEPRDGNPYFIWGKLELLDSPGEWFIKDQTLYLEPLTADLKAHVVEIKRRQLAFDLTDRSNITLQNIHVVASTIATGDPQNPGATTSSNVVLDGIHLRYPSHFTAVTAGQSWGFGLDSGIMLYGSNHTLKNSSIAFSAGNGVALNGKNHRLENNVIHDVDYAMTDAAAVFTGLYGSNSSGHVIEGNTFYDAGRSVLVHRATTNLKILRNHLYNGGLLTNDLGMTYTFQSDGGGTEIAYNLVHDNFAPSESMGIYLDNGSKNYLVHHNIVWNVRNALNLNLPSINNKVYNNTLLGWNESVGSGAAVAADCDATNSELMNNIFGVGTNLGFVFDGTSCPTGKGQFAFSSNLTQDINPKFLELASNDFSLQTGSSAIDAGKVITGITDGFLGAAPDLGALERGQAAFKAGATLQVPCVYGDDCTPKPDRKYGIRGQYFSDETLTTLVTTRVDPQLNFGGYGDTESPPGVYLPSGKNYGVRWTGMISIPETANWIFYVTADDGIRLWVGDQQLINRWDYKDPPVDQASINLQTGQKYKIKLEYHQGSGGARALLEWSNDAGLGRQVVPRQAFLLDQP
jgi:PA14 domain/Right handed beta helix region